jgi:hypothetical protein
MRGKMLHWVAWSEIIAGVFMLIDLLGRLISHNAGSLVSLNKAVFLLLGAAALAAGVGLLRKRRAAWAGSVALQAFLIPTFSVGVMTFRPGLGFFLPLGIHLPTTPEMVPFQELSIGVDFTVSLNAVHHPQFFAINLVALACLMALIFERP